MEQNMLVFIQPQLFMKYRAFRCRGEKGHFHVSAWIAFMYMMYISYTTKKLQKYQSNEDQKKMVNFQKVCFQGIFGCTIHYLFDDGFLGKGETITVSGKEPS